MRRLAGTSVARSRRAGRLSLVLLLLVAAAVLLGIATTAAAKDFSITDVTIAARVLPNGDVRVHETRTLDFNGAFSYVYWDYRTAGSDGIRILGASGPEGPYQESGSGQPQTYTVTSTPGNERVELHFDVADTAATFGVDYVATHAAKRWSDTAELYWQFVGDETRIPCDKVRITIALPAGVQRDQVRAWAHGPLWGDVTIAPNANVVLTVAPLPAETFVEARVLFPAAALPRAPLTSGARLRAVLDEEKKLADEANSGRTRERVSHALWAVVGIGAPLGALILGFVLWRRFGREPRPQFRGQYFRDIPEPALPPALVGYIWRMGDVDQGRRERHAARPHRSWRHHHRARREARGAPVRQGTSRSTYRLTLVDEKREGLETFEERLVTLLFDELGDGESLMMDELKDRAKAERQTFQTGYKEWVALRRRARRGDRAFSTPRPTVWRSGRRRPALRRRSRRAPPPSSPSSSWFLWASPWAIGVVLAARVIKRRSPQAAELHAQYAAMRRYLKDFGRLQEKPPDAVVLWEHFLVLAVVFGIADDVIAALAMKVPEVVNDPAFAPWCS